MKQEKCRAEVTSGAALFYPILYFLDTGGWFAAVLPAVVCHELGHLAALRWRGGRIRSLRLDVTGLRMDVPPFDRVADEILCTAAGPLAGLLWIPPALWIGGGWGRKSAAAALAINCFNLLPALPLDGGRLLLAATGRKKLTAAATLLSAAMLIGLAAAFRMWGVLVPAMLLVKTAVTA